MNFNRRGFSAIELFLVIALEGLVLLTLFSAYSAGIRIWKIAKDMKLIEDRGFYISLERMTEELSGYVRDFGEINFEGNANELSFPGVSDSETTAITYMFDKNQSKLFRKAVKFSDSLKDKMDEKKNELFAAKSVKFRYLFYDEKTLSSYWENDFSGEEDGIPIAVQMDISRNNGETSEFIFIPQ